jgi:hypothetical protein
VSKGSFHVAVGRLLLELPGCHNLKAKRKVVRPLVMRMRDRYGVSAAEVSHNDVWHSAVIAVAAVGASPSQLTGLLHDVMRFAERSIDGVVVEFGVEVMGLGELHGASADPREEVDAEAIENAWLEEEP